MKKHLLLVFVALLPFFASAQVEIDGIWYYLDEAAKQAEVTSGGDYSGTITIPAMVTYEGVDYSVASIGYGAFYRSSITDITLPESVKSIGEQAFNCCFYLNTITFSEGVESIGKEAFYSCISLKTITLPKSVTSIEDEAFSCCGFTTITLPENVTSIGGWAFARCEKLASITISKSLKSIGWYAFTGCSSLENIIVDEENTTYDSRNECNAIIETNSNTLVVGCRTTVIPEGVMTIGDNAFSNCDGLGDFIIPEGVTSIGWSTFSACYGLTSIVLPKSLNAIYGTGISHCYDLLDVWCYAEEVPNTHSDAFYGLPLENITLHVPASALEAYKTAELWSNFGSIVAIADENEGEDAEEIEIKVEIDGIAHNLRKDVKQAEVISGGDCSGAITIPATVTYEGEDYSVTSIGDEAFKDCRSLTAVVIPEGVTSIGYGAFWDCSSLVEVTIPEGVTSIGGYAFAGCSSLTTVAFPESATSFGDGIFSHCSSLITTNIPEGVTSLGTAFFSGCTSLAAITLPESVTSIGNIAFYRCNALTSINIPAGVSSLGNAVFFDCISLMDVYCHAEELPATLENTFERFQLESATLHVPASALEAYRTAEPWSNFGTIVAIAEEEAGIGQLTTDNGQWTIYDLAGRRVTRPAKGIYIVNGRKVVVK